MCVRLVRRDGRACRGVVMGGGDGETVKVVVSGGIGKNWVVLVMGVMSDRLRR